MNKHLAVVYIALMLTVGIMIAAVSCGASSSASCFPAGKWDADQDIRPCVHVTHVFEDGSFGYQVTDADGTPRYGGNVGARDR